MDNPQNGLRVLSLGTYHVLQSTAPVDEALYTMLTHESPNVDGGGIRGLSTLYILERIMYQLRPTDDPKKRVKPCEVFDVIAGTSTGGLLALMLGRLEMDVQSCIKVYKDLSSKVFTPRKRVVFGGSFLHRLAGSAPFSAEKLEAEIKKVVENNSPLEDGGNKTPKAKGNAGDVPLLVNPTQRCKVFVCVTMDNSKPLRLRSYSSMKEPALGCSIWEAGSATSAAPSLFDPVTLSNGATLRDGALLNNNPILQLMDELNVEFPGQKIACVVSVGTGVGQTKVLGKTLISVAKACASIATDANATAQQFKRSFASESQPLHDRYFRFEVEQGLQGLGVEEWKQMNLIFGVANAYLDDRREELKDCVTILQESTPMLYGSQKLHNESKVFHHEFLGLQPVHYFVPRKEDEKKLRRLLLTTNDNRRQQPSVVALTGLGGVGKTQLMLQYTKDYRDQFGAMFWIDCRSELTLSESFQNIARLLSLGTAARVQPREGETGLIRLDALDNVNAFKRWLRMRISPWLLLFDNADELSILRSLGRYFPTDVSGSIIVSSRRQEAADLFGSDRVMQIEGLPPDSARDLLLHLARINRPTQNQLEQAGEIVAQMDHLALAIDLAGNYIKVVGDLGQYGRFFRKEHDKLLRKVLGKAASQSYPHSVFAAWKLSMEQVPKTSARLYHVLCFLDRTNLDTQLFQRACSSKCLLNNDGELVEITAAVAGIAPWILDAYTDSNGIWDELEFLDSLYPLEALHFVRRNELIEGLYYNDKAVPTDQDSVLIIMEPFVHEIGRLMLDFGEFSDFAIDAITLVLHGLENDAEHTVRTPTSESRSDITSPILTPDGGAFNSPFDANLRLEALFCHLVVALEAIYGHTLQSDTLTGLGLPLGMHSIWNHKIPRASLCFVLLFALNYQGRPIRSSFSSTERLRRVIFMADMAFIVAPPQYGPSHLRYLIELNKHCWSLGWSIYNLNCWINITDGSDILIPKYNVPDLDTILIKSGSAAPSFKFNYAFFFAAVLERSISEWQQASSFTVNGGTREAQATIMQKIAIKALHRLWEHTEWRSTTRTPTVVLSSVYGYLFAADKADAGRWPGLRDDVDLFSIAGPQRFDAFSKTTLYRHISRNLGSP
ncbi:uncharacterized protein BP5553_06083 [Venustampulla echinocandica]|uniref:PNPLA domain-containing protein n=1 Tax=Venustampulla echinocandica TaxID=2656787 RepID=A0A370TMI8_9HELO|nr:uncharacterized protein BP5553_06083 [Venustampulla echinocandica]RDL36731.1 hypothetical protein BP5553_06083 [Venustampulla echinocandica]